MKKLIDTWFGRARRKRIVDDLRARIAFSRKSPEERRLLVASRDLKDRHVGRRCFVLGAGSSISHQDLGKLKGEFVISVSNTFVHPLFREFKPRYHVLPPLTASHGKLHSEEKFVVWLREMEANLGEAELVLHIGDRALIEKNGLFGNNAIHWVEYGPWSGDFDFPIDPPRIPRIWSVSEVAVTAAVYMGFDEIYLLGIDHDWFNGPLVYFFDPAKQHALRPNESNLEFVDAEFQMRRHAEIFRKYKYLYSMRRNIFNANHDPRHYMDMFPKVEFDSLF